MTRPRDSHDRTADAVAASPRGPSDTHFPRRRVVEQLHALGVEPGSVLLVHTSFRAIGAMEGGPEGLIDALTEALGPSGTLVMPSWGDDDEHPFDPARTDASTDLGVVARTFWRLPGAARSSHPFAFAARGPEAERILRDELPLPPHGPDSPVGRVHELDGRVLLLGVEHDADTTVHLAEVIADVPYRVPKRCTVLRDGLPTRIEYGENDHCCARFRLVDDWLTTMGAQSTGPVARAHARIVRSADIVDAVVPRLRADPLLFLHAPEDGCPDCEEARASIHG